jgi:hypothetical protein
MAPDNDVNLPSGHHWEWNPEEGYFMAVEDGTFNIHRPRKHKKITDYSWYRRLE